MPFTYSPQFRAMVISQVHDGKPVALIAAELGLNEARIYRWKKQDRIDSGLEPGTPTSESAELGEAKRRIRQLETELAATKRAAALFDESQVVRPKDLYPIIDAMGTEGYSLKACCRLVDVASSGFSCGGPSHLQLARSDVRGLKRSSPRSGSALDALRVGDACRPNSTTRTGRQEARPVGDARAWDQWPAETPQRPPEPETPRNNSGLGVCCVVLDAWSRKIVGWSIDARPTAAMVNSALVRQSLAASQQPGWWVHADHDLQYTSWAFSSHIRSAGLVQPLGTVGDAYDDAMVESLCGRMQT